VPPAGDLAAFLGGFVAAEGCFGHSGNRFRFAIGLGSIDASLCDVFAATLGVGRISRSFRRKSNYDDEVTFAVQSLRQLVEVVVPFMDAHLPASHKRAQYDAWREELLAYWKDRAKRRRPCTAPGCHRPRRARGLCRSHYYDLHGR